MSSQAAVSGWHDFAGLLLLSSVTTGLMWLPQRRYRTPGSSRSTNTGT
jgi:hypothetical protein